MPNRNILAPLSVLVISLVIALCVAAACATNYSPEQKTVFCKQAIMTVIKPECVRFDQLGLRYIEVCDAVVEDSVIACEAGFTEDPLPLCERIAAHAADCAFITEGDTDPSVGKLRNRATCERVANAAALACMIALTPAAPEPTPVAVPE